MTDTILVDGDEIAYRAAIGNEKEIILGDEHTLHSNWQEVRMAMEDKLHLIEEDTGCKVVLALSDTRNFRKELTDTYKANRKSTRRPMGLNRALQWMRDERGAYSLAGLEADDVLGIHSDRHYAICSSDKDLLTIPGKLWNPGKQKWTNQSVLDADRWFFTQMLMGDRTDGFSGCPKIGEVKAKKMLAGCQSYEEMLTVTVEAFILAGCDLDYIALQGRLARILRPGEYSEETAEVALWCFKEGSISS